MAVQKRTYKFSVADCDVIDKANLELFRQERDTWLALFEDDPAHNVRSQINELMWTDAVFRALNQMRGLGSESQPTGSHNRAIGEFIDKGFLASQVLGISKLTDPPNNDKNKNVVSLRRLLGDIKEKVHLVTRENFVCFDGLPFDYEEAARRHINSLTPEQRRQPRWLSREGPEAFGSSKISHLSFNELCCSPAGSRLDRIDGGILTAIEGMLSHQSITKIRGFRNKYLGHAADSISRRGHSLETYGFSLDEFAEAQQRIGLSP
ncbi:MAG: hypothetical protein ING19_04865 [Azospirillum sp.]|nr:hypothetical protein [Azospirillum sp.]